MALVGAAAPAWAQSYVGVQPPAISTPANGNVAFHEVPSHGPNGAQVLGVQFGRSPSGAPQELPFSGADVVELTAVALGCIAAGVLLTRSRRRSKAA
jgi:hypothetical protein